jgi:group I intron endonuclease
MYGIIYKATGPNSKVYIGQTVRTLAYRKSAHSYRAKKGDRRIPFQVALLKHGFSTFSWEQIDSAKSKEELDTKEKYWITHYKANDPSHGYNITIGGVGAKHTIESRRKMRFTHKKSPETRRKLSIAHKGKIAGEKHPMFGKHISDETRKKISEALKGNKNMAGKRLSAETRMKLSKSKKGKYDGEKHPQAKLNEETIRQIKTALINGETCVSLSKKYGVHKVHISKIKRGKIRGWANIISI